MHVAAWSGVAILLASGAPAMATDAFSFALTPTSTATYNVSASAPFSGTMAGDITATPPTRTKTGTLVLFPFPPHASCSPFGATQNDPVNISGSLTGSGTGSGIHPAGTFKLGLDPTAGTSSVQNLSLNLLGTSTAAVNATLGNFTYQTFCAVDPVCGAPFLIPLSLPLGTLTITTLTGQQSPGVAAGTLTAATGGGYDFSIPVMLTVSASANFGTTPFPIDPQVLPVVFAGHVDITGDTATITSTLPLNLAPPGVTTPTPLPPTPFTIPAGTGICDGANLILALTVNSSTVSVMTTSNIAANGTRVLCPCDWNHSGAVSVQDIFDFLNSYFAGTGDFNGTGGTTVQDIFDFLDCYFSRPIPC
jgi:hypothetical protein